MEDGQRDGQAEDGSLEGQTDTHQAIRLVDQLSSDSETKRPAQALPDKRTQSGKGAPCSPPLQMEPDSNQHPESVPGLEPWGQWTEWPR